jgi:two-component system LytT family response regulator
MIRTLIIDDEPAAVGVLEILLRDIPEGDVEIIGSCTDPRQGRDMIIERRPDLVFVDVEMPGMSGIELLRSIPDPQFGVVFVTAHDAYALEAFRLSAIDYLLKPIDRPAVGRAMTRIRSDYLRREHRLAERLAQLEYQLAHHPSERPKIAVSMSDRITFLPVADILYCEAQGAYTTIVMGDGNHCLASKSLGAFEVYLRPHGFFRIHHHALINLGRIKSFQRGDGGYVVMENDHRLIVASRRQRDFLRAISDRVI